MFQTCGQVGPADGKPVSGEGDRVSLHLWKLDGGDNRQDEQVTEPQARPELPAKCPEGGTTRLKLSENEKPTSTDEAL